MSSPLGVLGGGGSSSVVGACNGVDPEVYSFSMYPSPLISTSRRWSSSSIGVSSTSCAARSQPAVIARGEWVWKGAGLSPCDGRFAAKVDGDVGVRLSVRNLGSRGDPVADDERGRALRRGIKPGISTDNITGAVEDGGAAKIFEGGTSGACAGISPSKDVEGTSLVGISVELGPGDANAESWVATWVPFRG